MIISYIGKGYEVCDMCNSNTNQRYLAVPHVPALVDWSELVICKKCARREAGKKKWKELNK